MNHISTPAAAFDYAYDGRGVRISTAATLTGALVSPTRRYSLYLPELQLLSRSAWQAVTSSGTPAIATDFLWFGTLPVAQKANGGALRYTFTDHLGTPILQTDSAGSVIWRAEYEPFGNVFMMRAGNAADQPLRFPGQEVAEFAEDTTEQSYNIFRWYRSSWGRYTQADPIGLSGGLNLFRYGASNPMRNTDRTGLVCGVNWWTDEIGGFWGTLFGWALDHQFITWPTGSLGFQPNGGSAEVSVMNGVLRPIPGHVSHDTPNSHYDTQHETYFRESRPSHCPNCRAVWRCLDNFARQFESTTNQWCVLGDNCQTAVSDALSPCGLSRTPPTPPSPRFPHNWPGDPF